MESLSLTKTCVELALMTTKNKHKKKKKNTLKTKNISLVFYVFSLI